MKHSLEAEGLEKSYHGKKVVDEVSIEVNKGEVVGLLGPNGAGKTTTFYMVTGIVHPNSGRVFMENEEITGVPMHIRAQKGIGYLPQEQSIFRKMTVEENILVLWELTPSLKKELQTNRLNEILEELGIKHLQKRKCYELSGGEVRRVEIARALSTNPSFLLLDEPFTGVDPKTVSDLQKIIKYLKEKKGIGILITDHNVRETLNITDRSYIIHKGKVLLHGKAEEIATHKIAKEFYLGEEFKL